jgi:hypothetical protein
MDDDQASHEPKSALGATAEYALTRLVDELCTDLCFEVHRTIKTAKHLQTLNALYFDESGAQPDT